jgi:ubiquinone/menaquinone biosynthesis C-methylase UbiE
MAKKIPFEIDKDLFRKNLSKYTRKAFSTLPKLENPTILDIGCGSGVPTLELASLSNGKITAIDIDEISLSKLRNKIAKEKLSSRINIIQCSIFELDFPNEIFDIIWAEGSISVIGFEKGLKEWKALLTPRGFLMVHDSQGDLQIKLSIIRKCGYQIIDYFSLSKSVWLDEYFMPLQKHIDILRTEFACNRKALSVIKKEQKEIDDFRQNNVKNESIFFILQKL